MNCVWCAPATFRMEPGHGRSRVFGQWLNTEDELDTAIQSCPVDCIHWVDRSELPALEYVCQTKQVRRFRWLAHVALFTPLRHDGLCIAALCVGSGWGASSECGGKAWWMLCDGSASARVHCQCACMETVSFPAVAHPDTISAVMNLH